MKLAPVLSCLVFLTLAVSGCIEAPATDEDGKQLSGSTKELPPGTTDAPSMLLRSDKQSFEGTILAGTQDPASGMTGCGDVGQEGVDQMTFDWVIVGKESDGTPSVARRSVVKLTGTTPTTLDIDLFVIGPGGADVASSTSGDPAETIEITSPLAPGTYQLRVTACNLVAIQFTLEAVADYFAA